MTACLIDALHWRKLNEEVRFMFILLLFFRQFLAIGIIFQIFFFTGTVSLYNSLATEHFRSNYFLQWDIFWKRGQGAEGTLAEVRQSVI